MPTAMLSAHFTIGEFACKCGRWPACTITRPAAALVAALEAARAKHYPRGLVLLSGVRCVTHNKDVKGAPGSQHVKGRAVDFRDPTMTIKQAISCGFKGVGVVKIGGRWAVSHGDVRTGEVTVWQYPSRGPVPRGEWT